MELAIVRRRRRINIGTLPQGDDGVTATIAAIQALVDDAAFGPTRPAFVAIARDIREESEAATAAEFARELYRWLQAAIEFERDPADTELVRHPADMLAAWKREGVAYGDCDDMATLAAAIIAAAGFRPVVVTVGRNKPGRFEHIFAGVRIGALTRDGIFPIDAQENTGAGKWPAVPRVKLWSLNPSFPG